VQLLQPSPEGQLAPTGQIPPPGSAQPGGGPPSGRITTFIDAGRSTSTGASVASTASAPTSAPTSVEDSDTEAPQPERASQSPAIPAVVVHRMA
jgi:hypothetical protein